MATMRQRSSRTVPGVNRAPSKEQEEEEILPLGEESRRRGEAPGEPGVRGVASVPCVGVEPRITSLPQEGQKRAAPGTSLPRAEQVMGVAEVYHCPGPSSELRALDPNKRITRMTGRSGSVRDAASAAGTGSGRIVGHPENNPGDQLTIKSANRSCGPRCPSRASRPAFTPARLH